MNGAARLPIASGLVNTESVGEWPLRFRASAAPLVDGGVIDDILLALGFDGTGAMWPQA